MNITRDEGPPPRPVEPWTQVAGHTVTRIAPDAFLCQCGWRGSDRESHLHEAWPILVPRFESEPLTDWCDRLVVVHDRATEALAAIWKAEGMGTPIAPGEPFPVMSEEYIKADDLVAVLEHQLADLRTLLGD
jgi:hypothetical protein